MSFDAKYEAYRPKLNYIKKYRNASNAASGSDFDANANVECKNIATMSTELHKKDYIYANRLLMIDKLRELFDEETAEKYITQLETHEIYKHDETSLFPYCVAITMYPWLFDGMTPLGGKSDAPKHLQSFCGSFSNLVFAIASQFAGAVATPEFLMYMDYFIRKEYGDDYYLNPNEIVECSLRPRTIYNVIENYWQQIVYTMNEPAGARNYQCPFWNIAYFDEPYFRGMFENFVFPDGSEPKWESLKWLQEHFMIWFNEERTKKLLTFPVETFNLLNDGKKFIDEECADFVAQMWADGHSFFCYTSDSVDALSSCCLHGNEIVRVIDCDTDLEEDIQIALLCEKIKNGKNYKALSFNKDSNESEFVKITNSLIKKNNYKKLISITDSTGNTISVTPDHLIYVHDTDKNVDVCIPAGEIKNNPCKYKLIKKDYK